LFRAATLQLDLGSSHDKIRSFPARFCVGYISLMSKGIVLSLEN